MTNDSVREHHGLKHSWQNGEKTNKNKTARNIKKNKLNNAREQELNLCPFDIRPCIKILFQPLTKTPMPSILHKFLVRTNYMGQAKC